MMTGAYGAGGGGAPGPAPTGDLSGLIQAYVGSNSSYFAPSFFFGAKVKEAERRVMFWWLLEGSSSRSRCSNKIRNSSSSSGVKSAIARRAPETRSSRDARAAPSNPCQRGWHQMWRLETEVGGSHPGPLRVRP